MKLKKKRNKIIISSIIYLIAIIVPFPIKYINILLYVISYLLVGYEILKKAFRNILRGKVFDENFLMAIATLGAFAIGELTESVAVMLFYQVGELFQSYAVDKSRKSIADLMNIRPDYANVLDNNIEKKVSPEEIKINDTIIVKPGEKIPLDGIVIEGTSTIDTSSLTGESTPVVIKEKDEVLSGSINITGLLKINVTKEFGESTVSKILELVENASSKKSKSENFITKFANVYTPIVVIIACLIAVIPPVLFDASFKTWLYRALSFLVVSCPCALVISIPLSFFGGLGNASKNGILIKGSNYLEAISNLDTIVFDKTGTLTKGVFKLQKIYPVNIKEEELLKIAAHAEYYSSHPIGMAIRAAYEGTINTKKIKDNKEIPGQGLIVEYDNKQILIGNEKLLKENKISFEPTNELGTILYIAINQEYKGYIVIADEIKEEARETVAALKSKNIKTIMLTGDKKEVGESVGKILNLDEIYTQLLPQDKASQLETIIKASNGKIAFVGDGINDAPVLALSDIGIAMGCLGSDSAIEAADIVLMNDNLNKIISTIELSKKTMRIVKQNIFFAIFVKVVVLILTAIGIGTMWEAVFADVGVSIIAILNSLRILNNKHSV